MRNIVGSKLLLLDIVTLAVPARSPNHHGLVDSPLGTSLVPRFGLERLAGYNHTGDSIDSPEYPKDLWDDGYPWTCLVHHREDGPQRSSQHHER